MRFFEFFAVRRAVRVPPAEGMRPEPPAHYQTSIFEMAWLPGGPGPAGRMVLRNIVRHPVRAIASIAGIGFAVALLMTGLAMYGSFEELLVTQFSSAERQDVSLTFVAPRSEKARYALKALPGVIAVEAQRSVAVRIRAGHRQRTLSLTGIPDTPRLRLLVDRHGQKISPPQSGLLRGPRRHAVLSCSYDLWFRRRSPRTLCVHEQQCTASHDARKCSPHRC